MLLIHPNPKLNEEARPVKLPLSPLYREIISIMRKVMYANGGVGLAAPQIGLNIRLAIINATGASEDEKVLINPEIIETEWTKASGTEKDHEGCLSIPGQSIRIARQKTILVYYYDENDEFHQEELTDFSARIVQHEIDHMQGILIINRKSS